MDLLNNSLEKISLYKQKKEDIDGENNKEKEDIMIDDKRNMIQISQG